MPDTREALDLLDKVLDKEAIGSEVLLSMPLALHTRLKDAVATLRAHIEARPSEDVEALLVELEKYSDDMHTYKPFLALVAALRDAFVRMEQRMRAAEKFISSIATGEPHPLEAENATLRERVRLLEGEVEAALKRTDATNTEKEGSDDANV